MADHATPTPAVLERGRELLAQIATIHLILTAKEYMLANILYIDSTSQLPMGALASVPDPVPPEPARCLAAATFDRSTWFKLAHGAYRGTDVPSDEDCLAVFLAERAVAPLTDDPIIGTPSGATL